MTQMANPAYVNPASARRRVEMSPNLNAKGQTDIAVEKWRNRSEETTGNGKRSGDENVAMLGLGINRLGVHTQATSVLKVKTTRHYSRLCANRVLDKTSPEQWIS